MTRHETLTADDVEARFEVSRNVDYPFLDFAGEQQQRLYKCRLQLAGDFVVADGNVSLFRRERRQLRPVTGNVRCRNASPPAALV